MEDVQKNEKVTFPMRPGKKRFLVRKAALGTSSSGSLTRASEVSGTSTVTSPSNFNGKDKQRLLVSKSINPEELFLDTASPSNNDEEKSIVFGSPYGKLSPAADGTNVVTGQVQPRVDAKGSIVPYGILGSVDDYLRLSGGKSKAPSTGVKSSHLSRRSSSRKSLLLSEMRSSRGSVSVLSSEGSSSYASISSPNGEIGEVERQKQDVQQTTEEYLDQVREMAAAETAKRAKFAAKRAQAERDTRLSSMLAHEKIMYDRQERALRLHEQWVEEWANFKQAMCKLSNKRTEDLVVSRGEEYRERSEEYNFINAATPHHLKHGSEYWMMSLRGMGTRYVAVGNIFSGLFCPVRETSNLDMEVVRNPADGVQLNDGAPGTMSKPTWRDSPVLKKRQRQLASSLNKLRPHQVSKEAASSLVLSGEPLLEWAYVSIEKRSLEAQKENERAALAEKRREEESTMAKNEAQEKDVLIGMPVTGPNGKLEICEQDGTLATGVEKEGVLVNFSAEMNQPSTCTAYLHNIGTTAIYYKWAKNADSDARGRFFCSREKGVVLPNQTALVTFTFQSSSCGLWSETWTLETTPTAPSCTGTTLTLRGICHQVDPNKPAREKLSSEIKLLADQRREEEERRQREEAALAAVEAPEPSLDEQARRFEQANRPLGLYFRPELQDELDQLAQEIFHHFHANDMVLDETFIDEGVQSDFKEWKENPSLVKLREVLARLRAGETLRPDCRAPTVLEVQDDEEDDEEEEDEDEEECEEEDAEVDKEQGDAQVEPSEKDGSNDDSYLVREQTRLDQIAGELDERLMVLARASLRQQEEKSPVWKFVRQCVERVAFAIVEAYEVQDDDDEETAEVGGEDENEESQEVDPKYSVAFENVCTAFDELGIAIFEKEAHTRSSATVDQRVAHLKDGLVSSDQISTESLKDKKVLIHADLNVASNIDDPDILDELDATRILSKVAEAVDWVAKAGAKSVLVIGSRENTKSMEPVSEDLSGRLGREVVLFQDLQNEETKLALIGEVTSEDEDDDQGVPAAVDPDEIPVYMLGNISKYDTSDLVEVLQAHSEVYIMNSLNGMLIPTLIQSSTENTIDEPRRVIGPVMGTQMLQSDELLSQKHAIVIGGPHKGYPEIDPGEEREEDGEEDGEEDEEADEEEEEDEEEEDEDEDEEDDDDEEEEQQEEKKNEQYTPPPQGVKFGFGEQLATIDGAIEKCLAQSVLIVGPLAIGFHKALEEMGDVAKRLGHCSQKNIIIPEDPSLVSCVDSSTLNSYRAQEREWMRSIVTKARRLNVVLQILDEFSSDVQSQLSAWTAAHHEVQSSVLILNGATSALNTRHILRAVGSKAKQLEWSISSAAPEVNLERDNFLNGLVDEDEGKIEDEQGEDALSDDGDSDHDGEEDTGPEQGQGEEGNEDTEEEDTDLYGLVDTEILDCGAVFSHLCRGGKLDMLWLESTIKGDGGEEIEEECSS